MFEGNPFPGLRPFQFDENYLFFGREEQVSQLLQRLGNTRFLAVVGASGSGKSSLVRAGLLPELHGGTMTSTSIAWELAIMRPGGDPLTNLAESMVESGLFGEENEENILQTRATLSRSGLGLIEAYRQSSIDKGANLLLLVDQFEEIFRFRQSGSKASQEAAHFIQLLLETARQSEVPIYIILTMRSDFLGDCAEFKGLAEAVNEGEYLIPRLNRKQRARAIEGPVKVGGADISPRLKQQLLNDIGDDPDQLRVECDGVRHAVGVCLPFGVCRPLAVAGRGAFKLRSPCALQPPMARGSVGPHSCEKSWSSRSGLVAHEPDTIASRSAVCRSLPSASSRRRLCPNLHSPAAVSAVASGSPCRQATSHTQIWCVGESWVRAVVHACAYMHADRASPCRRWRGGRRRLFPPPARQRRTRACCSRQPRHILGPHPTPPRTALSHLLPTPSSCAPACRSTRVAASSSRRWWNARPREAGNTLRLMLLTCRARPTVLRGRLPQVCGVSLLY